MADPGIPVTFTGDVPADTNADAHAVQRDVYRRMGGCGRLAVAFRLSESVRHITLAGIRARHPDYSDEQVRLAHARLTLGDTLVRSIWPDRELVQP